VLQQQTQISTERRPSSSLSPPSAAPPSLSPSSAAPPLTPPSVAPPSLSQPSTALLSARRAPLLSPRSAGGQALRSRARNCPRRRGRGRARSRALHLRLRHLLLSLSTLVLLLPTEHGASPSQIRRSLPDPAPSGKEELKSTTPLSVARLRPRRTPLVSISVGHLRPRRAHHYKLFHLRRHPERTHFCVSIRPGGKIGCLFGSSVGRCFWIGKVLLRTYFGYRLHCWRQSNVHSLRYDILCE